MRVLMLSWEYPPLVVGGLGRHVEALARELVTAGHDVRVVTRGESATQKNETRDGVRVIRAALDPIAVDFTVETLIAWAQVSEHTMLRAALTQVDSWQPDVLHAHDWLVAQTAISVAGVTGAPLVTTFHATEGGRHQGWLPEKLNRAIHSVERWLASRSAEIITCSGATRGEATELFELDPAAVTVVPNGIAASRWRTTAARRRAERARLAGDEGPLIAFAGRLVHEKGVQTLLTAARALREQHPGLRVVVAGTGPYEPDLRKLARALRFARAVHWLGFVHEDQLPAVLAAADAVVVPSFYEPFGLVALEAAAAGTPVVVAETGGLHDLIDQGLTAGSFPPGDTYALAEVLGKLLADPDAARRRAAAVARTVGRDFGWPAVAAATELVYRRSLMTRAGTPTATL